VIDAMEPTIRHTRFANMSSIWTKLRRHGLSGSFRFVAGRLRERRQRSFFLRAAARDGNRIPEKGFTLVGHFSSSWSLGKVMRDLACSLRTCGIPFQTFDVPRDGLVAPQDVDDLLTPRASFRIRRFDHVIDGTGTFPELPGIRKSQLAFWEFETGLLEGWPGLRNEREVTAMSDFDVRVFRNELPRGTTVRKLLYPFRAVDAGTLPAPSEVRARHGLPARGFAVFFNFDFSSSVFRKNPQGALRAFATAFRNVPDALLVFKTNRADDFPEKRDGLFALARSEGIADRFFLLDGFLPQRDVYALTNACDAYLSLHRGEGFGLGVAEAMSLGKPVVVSDCSSTTEFCVEGAALRVPCSVRAVAPDEIDHVSYHGVRTCFEPDLNWAAEALRRLYDDSATRRELGEAARREIAGRFSPAAFKASAEAFLSEPVKT